LIETKSLNPGNDRWPRSTMNQTQWGQITLSQFGMHVHLLFNSRGS